jgi:hypothetical protein
METQISLRLPETLLDDIDRRAEREGSNRSRVIRALLESALRGQVSAPPAPYVRVRDLVGSVTGPPGGGGAANRRAMIQGIRDRRG